MPRKPKQTTQTTDDIPDFEIQSLARAILPTIQAMFEREEIRQEFEEWQRSQSNNKTHSSIITYCNSEKGRAAYAEWQKQQLNNKILNESMPVESIGQPR